MPTINTGDLIKSRVWCTDGPQASVNTLNFQCVAEGGAPNTDQQFCDALAAVLDALVPPVINNNANYNGIQCQLLTTVPQLWAPVKNTVGSSVGSGGALALPKQTCGLASLSTPLSGRRFRGRMYFPFPSVSADTGDGTPTGAYVITVGTWIAQWLNFTGPFTPGGGTFAPVIVHSEGKTPTPTPTQIVNVEVANAWATQRRRGAYGRLNTSPI